MQQALYRIILQGTLAQGANETDTSAGLAKLFKTTPEKAAALLSGKARVIQRGLSQDKAEQLCQTILSIGAMCNIEAETPAASITAPADPSQSLQEKPMPPTRKENTGSRYSLEQFVNQTAERDHGQGLFELEDARLLEINLETEIWIKTGAMVAYRGDMTFTRESVLEKGIGKFLKKAVSGEGARLTKAEGQGALYLADQGKKITILELKDEALYVNGNDILALEMTIDWDINIMRKVTAMMAGGLFNVRLEGEGMIAITSHYDPMTLKVSPGNPVITDPNATIAWSGSLQPDLRTDVSFKTFLGRGSGESIQMVFEGDGFVVIQPYEEIYFQGR
jgi:uncharacterized protein (AIM24 family)